MKKKIRNEIPRKRQPRGSGAGAQRRLRRLSFGGKVGGSFYFKAEFSLGNMFHNS